MELRRRKMTVTVRVERVPMEHFFSRNRDSNTDIYQ